MENSINHIIKLGLDNVPWIGTVVFLMWIIVRMYLAGILRRIDKLEADSKSSRVHEDLASIRERLVAIEAKLNIPINIKTD